MTQRTPEQIAARLTKAEKLCLQTWGQGVEAAPVPDSIWHGRYSGFKRYAPDGIKLSPLGLAVRSFLTKDTQP